MTRPLPLNAKEIGLEWPIEEGGFGVTAKTDSTGQPIIGVYPLNREGQPSGQQSEYAHDRLMLRLVVGYDERYRAIVVFADISLTVHGLKLRVLVPPHIMARGLDRYLSAAWESQPPRRYQLPANLNWLATPLAQESDK